MFAVTEKITNLITNYNQSAELISQDGKISYLAFVNNVKQSLSEYFIFFNEIQSTYYNEEDYSKSYRLFQEEMT